MPVIIVNFDDKTSLISKNIYKTHHFYVYIYKSFKIKNLNLSNIKIYKKIKTKFISFTNF